MSFLDCSTSARVTEAVHGDAAAEVEIAFASDIKNIAAVPVTQNDFKPTIAGHDIFREKFAHGLMVVADNG